MIKKQEEKDGKKEEIKTEEEIRYEMRKRREQR